MGSVSLNLQENLDTISAKKNASTVKTVSSDSSSKIEDLEFLKMLTTQLKYQDPMNPSDNQAFADQMATLTTMQTNNKQLDALKEIKASLEAMNLSMYGSAAAMTNSASVSLINKEVKIASETIYVEDGKAEMNLDISKMDPNAEVVINDQFGNEVLRRKVTAILSDTSVGEHEYVWDGISDTGEQQSNGEYGITFELDGERYNSISAMKQDIVTGVRFDGDAAGVIIGGKNYPVARIIEVL